MLTSKIGLRVVSVLSVMTLASAPIMGQVGPFINGQNWQGGVGVSGGILLINTDADIDLEEYPIIPVALANNSLDVDFLLSPDGTVLYARAFGTALTGLCSAGENQIYFFSVVPDDNTSGHLETIFNGGLCISGPQPDHQGLYEVTGQTQHVAYVVEANSSLGATRQLVHWINLVGTNENDSTELNIDVDGVFFKFTPDGSAALVKHGLGIQPTEADYTLIDLCPPPRLGNMIPGDVGGRLFGLPSPDPTAQVIEEPPGSGDLVARISHPDIQTTGSVDLPLTPCSGGGPLTGACCEGAVCTVTTAAQCLGEHQGDGTTCPHAACVAPPPTAELSLTKTDSPDPVNAGEALTYTIEVRNGGPDAATGVLVLDSLPPGVTFDPDSSSPGCSGFGGGAIDCDVGNIANGGTATVTIAVIVDPTTRGPITNTAEVEGNEVDTDDTDDVADEETLVTAQADLSLTKTATPNPVAAGGTLIYEFVVTNSGPSTSTGITVLDTLPPGVTPLDDTGSPVGAGGVSCNAQAVDPGDTARLTVVATVDPATPDGTILSNAASVTGAEPDSKPKNNSTSVNTLVTGEVVGSVARFIKIVDTDTPIPGGAETFASLDAPVIDGDFLGFSARTTLGEGVYRSINGVLATVADRSMRAPSAEGNFLLLSSSGATYSMDGLQMDFLSEGNGTDGIYLTNACGLTVVANRNTPVPGRPGEFFNAFGGSVLRNGAIAFVGSNFVPGGIFLWDGNQIGVVADGNTPIPDGVGNFTELGSTAFDGTDVAFYGGGGGIVEGRRDRPGIYATVGGQLVKVADMDTVVPGTSDTFIGFRTRLSMDQGQVAFIGISDTRSEGIYLYDLPSQTLSVIVDASTPLPCGAGNFGSIVGSTAPSINQGAVAFAGRSPNFTDTGIYLFKNGSIRPVLLVGQTLDGKLVGGLDMERQALSGSRLAFMIQFLSGPPFVFSEAIYVAQLALHGDSDGDNDLDLFDHADFNACTAGPDTAPTPGAAITVQECLNAFDFCMDGDIDTHDAGVFQQMFTGE